MLLMWLRKRLEMEYQGWNLAWPSHLQEALSPSAESNDSGKPCVRLGHIGHGTQSDIHLALRVLPVPTRGPSEPLSGGTRAVEVTPWLQPAGSKLAWDPETSGASPWRKLSLLFLEEQDYPGWSKMIQSNGSMCFKSNIFLESGGGQQVHLLEREDMLQDTAHKGTEKHELWTSLTNVLLLR